MERGSSGICFGIKGRGTIKVSSIFLDTSPFIYFLDGIEPFASKVEKFLLSAMDEKCLLYTSAITDTEYFVHPYREKNFMKIMGYKSFVQNAHILKISIGEDIAEKAAQIRAEYHGIKTADSLQLAASIVYDCNTFLTNDKQLRQIKEISVKLVDEL